MSPSGLLSSTELARMAYVAGDGTPRVFPMLFHLGRQRAGDVHDAVSTPPEVLLVRGASEVTDVKGLVPEYALAQHRYAGPVHKAANVAAIDHPGTRMVEDRRSPEG